MTRPDGGNMGRFVLWVQITGITLFITPVVIGTL
jgi:hypothetical protein